MKIYLPHGFVITDNDRVTYAEIGLYSEEELSNYNLAGLKRYLYDGSIVYTNNYIPAAEIVGSPIRINGIKKTWRSV